MAVAITKKMVMGMRKCKACGRDFASTDKTEEICYPCNQALKRLNGYAVPVVRCKDCKYSVWDDEETMWKCVYDAEFDEQYGDYFGFAEYNDGDHFCSYGERREGE